MPPRNRNAPCPCGSGRKYKRCHGSPAAASSAGLSVADGGETPGAPGALPTPRTGARWEVDLLPLPIALDDEPDARLVMLLVMGGGYVLHQELLNQPASDLREVARILLDGVQAVVDRVGFWPQGLAVRTSALADAISALTPGPPARIEAGPLPEFDDASRSLLAHLSPGQEERPLGLSAPETWKGWRLPPGLVADLFTAAAAFFRARPWRHIANEDLLEATCPTGNCWTACVLGNGGIESGLALYADPEDVERQFMETDPHSAMAALRGTVLSLTFNRRDDLPKVMRKEILAAGWTVAALDAYPTLMAINTPGGGVTANHAADLREILQAVSRFAAQFPEELAEGRWPPTWHDPASGVTLSTTSVPGAGTALWPLVDVLSSALPAGPGANPAAALEEHEADTLRQASEALLTRFHRELSSEYAPATAAKHGSNAGLLLAFLADFEEIPIEAMTEYDLRSFLFDWIHRKVMAPKGVVMSMPVSLKRFFRFLDSEHGLEFPWAWEMLADREAYQIRNETWPGGFGFDPAVQQWIGELTGDLDSRLLLPDGVMANGNEWGAAMGMEEYALYRELARRWLLWRDEVIAAGLIRPGDAGEELVRRQRAWELAPHPAHNGRRPVEVVVRERKRQGEQRKG